MKTRRIAIKIPASASSVLPLSSVRIRQASAKLTRLSIPGLEPSAESQRLLRMNYKQFLTSPTDFGNRFRESIKSHSWAGVRADARHRTELAGFMGNDGSAMSARSIGREMSPIHSPEGPSSCGGIGL